MQVIKKDGSLQEFDQGKIARVVEAAGLTHDQAQALADTVARWLSETGKDPIPTNEIRDKVVTELQRVNSSAANLFVWYESTKG